MANKYSKRSKASRKTLDTENEENDAPPDGDDDVLVLPDDVLPPAKVEEEKEEVEVLAEPIFVEDVYGDYAAHQREDDRFSAMCNRAARLPSVEAIYTRELKIVVSVDEDTDDETVRSLRFEVFHLCDRTDLLYSCRISGAAERKPGGFRVIYHRGLKGRAAQAKLRAKA